MVEIFFIIVVLCLVAERFVELGLAKRNRNKAMAAGGKEFGAGHYPVIVAMHIAWFVAWVLEGWHLGPSLSCVWPLWLALFLLAEGLRYWSITALGSLWNTRIIIIPGVQRIQHGPYRFLPHPVYIAVTIELISVPLIFGAWITAVGATLLNAIMLLGVRIPAENRALASLK